MGKDLLIRLTTGAGRTRITMPDDATLQDLKDKIELQTGIATSAQKLTFERDRPISGSDSSLLTALGFEQGTMVFLKDSKEANIQAQITNTSNLLSRPLAPIQSGQQLSAAAANLTEPSSSSTSKPGGQRNSVQADPTSSKPISFEGASMTLNGKVIPYSEQELMKKLASEKKSGEAAAGFWVNGKPMDAVEKKEDPKHMAFEKFLRARKFETSALPGYQSYLPIKLEKGKQNRLPPPITLAHQKFRHVDHLEYMNTSEIQNFVSYWQKHDMMTQRGGFLYGYYRDDKHYEDGMRAVLEAIWEPDQGNWDLEGGVHFSKYNTDMSSLAAKNSPTGIGAGWDTKIPDLIALRLGLDRLGWISTGLPRDELLNAQEVVEIAKLQLRYQSDKHYSGYAFSPFVSCIVRPDPEKNGQPDTKVFQVSDQCVAMCRDGVLDEKNTDPKRVRLSKPSAPDMVLPSVLESGKDASRVSGMMGEEDGQGFDPDWCVVSLSDGVPKKKRSIFLHSKFPVANRPEKIMQTRKDLKEYMRAVGKGGANWQRFADFHLLCFLAKELDLETVYQICDAVKNRKEVPDGVLLMVDAMCEC